MDHNLENQYYRWLRQIILERPSSSYNKKTISDNFFPFILYREKLNCFFCFCCFWLKKRKTTNRYSDYYCCWCCATLWVFFVIASSDNYDDVLAEFYFVGHIFHIIYVIMMIWFNKTKLRWVLCLCVSIGVCIFEFYSISTWQVYFFPFLGYISFM